MINKLEGESVVGGLEMRDRVSVKFRTPRGNTGEVSLRFPKCKCYSSDAGMLAVGSQGIL